jgi:hypothetical protein
MDGWTDRSIGWLHVSVCLGDAWLLEECEGKMEKMLGFLPAATCRALLRAEKPKPTSSSSEVRGVEEHFCLLLLQISQQHASKCMFLCGSGWGARV